MNDCLFCKIIKKDIPAAIVAEDEQVLVFEDINPKADIHLLIIPKKHIQSVNEISDSDKEIVSHLILMAKKIAIEQGVAKSGYKLQFNVGRGGGQIVDHLHLHLLANKS